MRAKSNSEETTLVDHRGQPKISYARAYGRPLLTLDLDLLIYVPVNLIKGRGFASLSPLYHDQMV